MTLQWRLIWFFFPCILNVILNGQFLYGFRVFSLMLRECCLFISSNAQILLASLVVWNNLWINALKGDFDVFCLFVHLFFPQDVRYKALSLTRNTEEGLHPLNTSTTSPPAGHFPVTFRYLRHPPSTHLAFGPLLHVSYYGQKQL